jgi:adenine-specific DNA-methyltransferase
MSQKYDKLKTLLKELFQLDQPDLDFGLYRIMHAKSAEVTQFLEVDLLPQVKRELSASVHDLSSGLLVGSVSC